MQNGTDPPQELDVVGAFEDSKDLGQLRQGRSKEDREGPQQLRDRSRCDGPVAILSGCG
jgi:hypothetical protein